MKRLSLSCVFGAVAVLGCGGEVGSTPSDAAGSDGPPSSGCATVQVSLTDRRLTDAPGLSSYPVVAATPEGLAMAWDDDRAQPGNQFYNTRQVFFRRLGRDGTPMGPEIALTALAQGDAWRPSVACGSSTCGVAYVGGGGISFVRVDGAGVVNGPTLIADGRYDQPSLVWTGDGYALSLGLRDVTAMPNDLAFVRVSADGQPGALTPLTQGTEGGFPRLAWDGAGFGVAWQDRRNGGLYQIYFRKLHADGSPAEGELRVTTSAGSSPRGISVAPQIVWTGSEYGIAFSDTRSRSFQVYLARISASGTSVLGEQQLSTAFVHADTPGLLFANGRYWVTWVEKGGQPGCGGFELQPGSPAIDRGVDLGLPYNGASPDIGACEYLGTGEGASRIQAALVDPNGGPSSPVLVSQNTGFSAFPSLAPTPSGLWAAWFDSRDGGREIYAAQLQCP